MQQNIDPRRIGPLCPHGDIGVKGWMGKSGTSAGGRMTGRLDLVSRPWARITPSRTAATVVWSRVAIFLSVTPRLSSKSQM